MKNKKVKIDHTNKETIEIMMAIEAIIEAVVVDNIEVTVVDTIKEEGLEEAAWVEAADIVRIIKEMKKIEIIIIHLVIH
jgi:hypothetical protein